MDKRILRGPQTISGTIVDVEITTEGQEWFKRLHRRALMDALHHHRRLMGKRAFRRYRAQLRAYWKQQDG